MWILDGFFLALGLIIGSFLNVCIARLPKSESVVFPRSHCTQCGGAIAGYDNIPVLSYLILRGRCRICGAGISWQYPAVEVLTAATFVTTYWIVGVQLKTAIFLLFFSAMIVLVFIDLNHRILPNLITLPGIVVGVICSLLAPVEDGTAEFLFSVLGWSVPIPRAYSVLDSLLGAMVCGGFLWVVAELYLKIRKIEGLGFGDIKLMGMVGAFLGVRLALMTIMLGSFVGAVTGLIFIRLAGKDSRYELPFGSFLGLAAIFAALWGQRMIQGYSQAIKGF
ncbi:MAG: prepilin peptidase [Acidobacteriota bacterium]